MSGSEYSLLSYGQFEKMTFIPPDPLAQTNMAEYAEAGFPGCVGSTDTHIPTERCEYNLKNNHLGAKSSHNTRRSNLTCNHRRQILHTTRGGPGHWNDSKV